MLFTSTRHPHKGLSLSQALTQGLAPDGGLYVPAYFPKADLDTLDSELPFHAFAAEVLKDYFRGDVLENTLPEICQRAFNFPLVLTPLNENTSVLELFHGPTLAFKDFGARFLAESLSALSHEPITIMVATSGDTGSAVAAAFYLKPKIRVVVLYPKDKISKRQEHQITCWGQNVKALAVEGNFDNCQALIKEAFQNKEWQAEFHLGSANSINIGRLLPQLTYYAYISLQHYREYNEEVGFIIPSGNLGHATAAYWAKAMGFPIRELVLSTNANRVLEDYIASGDFKPRPSIETLANAMDVGNPSNFERLINLFPNLETFRKAIKSIAVSDDEIRETIKEVYESYRYLLCPHSATAYFTRQKLSDQQWIVVATADAAKFETVLEPLLGIQIPVPETLKHLLERPQQTIVTEASLSSIYQHIYEG